MLKILSVNPTGMFAYGVQQTVWLDSLGVCMLEGKNLDKGGGSNGSGKTSLFYVITQLLFGKNPSGEAGEDIVNEVLGKYWASVQFQDRLGVMWRVIDTKRWRKTDKYPDEYFSGYEEVKSEIHRQGMRYSGTDVYLERWDYATGWVDERSTNRVTGDSRLDLKATRKRIQDIIGITYEQFMSVAYLAQQQSLKFTQGTHKQKLEVLAELCDLGIWDARVTQVREDKKAKEAQIDRQKSTLDGMRRVGGSLEAPDKSLKDVWTLRCTDLDSQIHGTDEEIRLAESKRDRWQDKCAEFDKSIADKIAEQRTLQVRSEQISAQIGAIFQDYSNECIIIRSSARPHEANQLDTEIGELRGKISARSFDLEQILSGAGKCPRCHSIVTADHLTRHRNLLAREIEEMKAAIVDKSERLAIVIEEWERETHRKLDEATGRYNARKAELENERSLSHSMGYEANMAVEELRKQRSSLAGDPNIQIRALGQQRLRLISEKAQYLDKIKSWDIQYEQFQKYNSTISDLNDSILRLDKDAKMLDTLDRLFGDKGIKAYKLNNVLSTLNVVLKECLDVITDGTVSVWVTQYRQKGDGELSADIQIMVRDGNKKEVPFGLYSGGEKQQIMLALIGAFWQLASRYGSGVNILCLDEIFGPLDEQNTQHVFEYLEYMRLKGKSSIFVVTHDPKIKDQIIFDQVWVVHKKGDISHIVRHTKEECDANTAA